MERGIRVLVIDDSMFVRECLKEGLDLDPHIQVVGTASDPFSARDLIIELRPDVLTLDVSMPRMNGVEFLQRLMPQHPLPTVMVSAFTENGASVTLEALEAGAVDFVAKPRSGRKRSFDAMIVELRTKIKIASTVDVSGWKRSSCDLTPVHSLVSRPEDLRNKLIAIGASTGGTEAIKQVLMRLPSDSPGVVIVQHMPEKFTESFARRLNSLCRLNVFEAGHGDPVKPGTALVAPGNRHMEVVRHSGQYRIHLSNGENVSGHRPSVDVLMSSVARCAGKDARGVILTGMGSDGAKGLLEIRQAGGGTFGQDESSCVVFGMPKKAYEIGAVQKLVSLDRMAEDVMGSFKKRP